MNPEYPTHGDVVQTRRRAESRRSHTALDQIAADADEVLHFARLFDELPEPGERYAEAVVHTLANDPDGSVLELPQRHRRGERVAEVHLDFETGERFRLPDGQPIPRRHFPILEAAAVTDRFPLHAEDG